MDWRKAFAVAGGMWLAISQVVAAPLRVMTIGDSLSEEYRFESIFSGPQSNPLEANTMNWVELLSEYRDDDVTFGGYEPSLLQYPDFRDAGYEYNFGVPSFETVTWIDVINSTFADLLSGDPERMLRYSTKREIIRQLDEEDIDVVVIFLGGNDQYGDYDLIFEEPQTPALLANAVTNIGTIHQFIRSNNSSVPIVICTFPDIGATQEISSAYTDPALRVRARQRIADANAALIAKAAQLGATVARIDQLTDRIFDESPFHLNGTVMQYEPHPDNPPDRIFCRDGFHPATMGQSLIANLIMDAITRATGRSIAPFTNRFILDDILGLDPDQPYLGWAGSAGGMTANPDGDGMQNLVEYVLGTSATVADSPLVFSGNGALTFPTSPTGLRFADLKVMESTTLGNDWAAVPQGRISVVNGNWTVAPKGTPKNFYRLEATPKP